MTSRPRLSLVLAGLALAWATWFMGSRPLVAQPLTPVAGQPLILHRGIGPEPESLDPHRARSEAALTVLRDLYQGLTELGSAGTPVLAAADRCETSADGLTYTFHLRGGGRWSNGDRVVAEDFAAAWRRLVDSKTAAQYAQLLAPVRGASAITAGSAAPESLGVRAADDATLVVDLVRPTPYFLGLLAHPATFPIHRPSLALNGRRFARPGVMISNGAFVLSGWDFGSHVSTRRNPYYWDRANNSWDGVDYYSMPEAAAEFRAFRSGELDLTSTVPAAQAAWIRAHMAADLHLAPQLAVYYLGLNLTRPPFDKDPALRQALSMVIDRERLVASVTGLGEAPAYTLVPPQVFNYSPAVPPYAHWPLAQRIQRARELLRASGLSRPFAVELRYNSGELHSRIAIAIASMWKEGLGIETILHAEEFKVLLQDIDRGDTQVFRASWIADYNDAYSFLQLMQSGFGINLPRYADGDFDALLARANQSIDATQRRELLEKAEGLMMANQPLIPIYFYVAAHLVGSQIRGWKDNPMNIVYSKSLTKDRQ